MVWISKIDKNSFNNGVEFNKQWISFSFLTYHSQSVNTLEAMQKKKYIENSKKIPKYVVSIRNDKIFNG